MGFFTNDEKNKEIDASKEFPGIVTPKSQRPAAQKEADSKQQKEVRSMAGYESIDEVTEAARKRSTDAAPAAQRGRAKTPEQLRIEYEIKLKAERMARARETTGKYILGRVAKTPYELWAVFAGKEYLTLKPEEQKDLAEQYFLLAEAGDFNFTAWYWVLGGIVLANGELIATRVRMLAEDDDNEEDALKKGNEALAEMKANAGKPV